MTELEKNVYNTYLRISRTRSGKHFKYRKKFDNFEENKAYVPVKKIAKLFLKWKFQYIWLVAKSFNLAF